MKVAIIIFPGSNCDHDAEHSFRHILNCDVTRIWHKEQNLQSADFVFIPGGFSYGDYLRCGAIARFSPVMNAVIDFAKKGYPVMGVCNGFQILTESHLLPGALLRNTQQKYICKTVQLRCENRETLFSSGIPQHKLLSIPIAHGEGNYYISATGLQRLKDNNQIAFRYVDANGNAIEDANPNGSIENIAGIYNSEKNILGMMPHPERAAEKALGSSDGLFLFQSILKNFAESV